MNGLLVVSFIIWLYILSVLKRGKLDFWYFCLGSVGLFIFLIATLGQVVVEPLSKAVTAVAGIIGNLTGLYRSNFQYGMLFIQKGLSSISLYIDFECAGVIEMVAFTSLLWFFPVYKLHEKIAINIVGAAIIFIGNVIRIFVIAVMIRIFGNDIYYVAHTIIGRFIFYGFSIVLYYYVFTKGQIQRQRVGGFKYEHC